MGITLDVGCGGKDLLTPNLIPNAGFELAPPLLHCSYNISTSTLTTPNGYKTYYPTPTSLYGWGAQSGEITLSEGRTFYKESSHYLTFRPKDTDSVPCRIISTLFPLEVKEGERYSLSCFVSSDLAEARVSIVRDTISPEKVSTEVSIRGDVYWSRKDVVLQITTATDSAYLMIESRPIRRTDEGMGYTQPRGYVSLDELWLTRKEGQSDPEVPLPNSLMKLLRGLDPDFVRFPPLPTMVVRTHYQSGPWEEQSTPGTLGSLSSSRYQSYSMPVLWSLPMRGLLTHLPHRDTRMSPR